jgi:hypothetical protein
MPWHAYNRRVQEANRAAEEIILQDLLQVRCEESDKRQQMQKVPLGSVTFEK